MILVSVDDAIKLATNHTIQLLALAVFLTWLLGMFLTAAVTAMHSPTAKDTGRYQFWFKTLHLFIGAITRARRALKDPSAPTGKTMVMSKDQLDQELDKPK